MATKEEIVFLVGDRVFAETNEHLAPLSHEKRNREVVGTVTQIRGAHVHVDFETAVFDVKAGNFKFKRWYEAKELRLAPRS